MIALIELDITDREQVFEAITEFQADVIIHCAAWTDVDAAEKKENREKVRLLNVSGTENIALAAKMAGAKMIYLSTDYVFDGSGDMPWQPDDKNYAPLNYYGQTKLEGELAVAENSEKFFIVRTAWVFGLNGKNFVRTMAGLGKTHDTLRVVSDQIGTPTYAADLAVLLADMSETEEYGYYHATNSETEPGGYISWYDFACEIFRQMDLDTEVIPVTTEEYGANIAQRPLNSRLDKSKLIKAGFEPLPDWKDALKRYLEEADHLKNFFLH